MLSLNLSKIFRLDQSGFRVDGPKISTSACASWSTQGIMPSSSTGNPTRAPHRRAGWSPSLRLSAAHAPAPRPSGPARPGPDLRSRAAFTALGSIRSRDPHVSRSSCQSAPQRLTFRPGLLHRQRTEYRTLVVLLARGATLIFFRGQDGSRRSACAGPAHRRRAGRGRTDPGRNQGACRCPSGAVST